MTWEELAALSCRLRTERAEFKAEVRAGVIDITEAMYSPRADGVQVAALMRCVPRLGKWRCERLLDRMMINPSRRIDTLTERQKQILVAYALNPGDHNLPRWNTEP